MLCVSRSANLTLPIREQKVSYYENGNVKDVRPPLVAVFAHTFAVPEYAREALSQMPGFWRGVGEDEDPFTLCGIFDTKEAADKYNWNDEEKAFAEDALRRGAGGSYILVEKPATAKPWPNYDKVVGADEAETAFLLTKKVVEDGYDVRTVREYEVENAARELVLEAYDVLIAEAEADVIGVIQA